MPQEHERPAGRPGAGSSSSEETGHHSAGRRTAQAEFPVLIAHIEKNRRETLRIALDRYQGVDLVDIRVCMDLSESSGIKAPTKKGVALRLELLPALIEALGRAEATARASGLLGRP